MSYRAWIRVVKAIGHPRGVKKQNPTQNLSVTLVKLAWEREKPKKELKKKLGMSQKVYRISWLHHIPLSTALCVLRLVLLGLLRWSSPPCLFSGFFSLAGPDS